MTIPEGWKLVPVEPTSGMIDAYKRAISGYIESLPEDERAKVKGRPHGWRVKSRTKLRLRWAAMISAAPEPPGGHEAVHRREV